MEAARVRMVAASYLCPIRATINETKERVIPSGERRMDWRQVWNDDLKSGLLTVTGRQSTPGPGHCSNRRQLNSSRKGRQDSHPRVQTVQAGRGPGGWTRRRALATWLVLSAAPGPRYEISYPISTKSLISKTVYPDFAPISCTR